MKDIVTGYGGSVILGHYINGVFKYQTKFPRKQKKALKKQMPWTTFHKSQLDYVIKNCVPKDWYKDNHSFALTISKTVYNTERTVYFCPYFHYDTPVINRNIFFKRIDEEPVKNI